MSEPLDPMLPVEPGSATDRILSDHRAMEALRHHRITVSHMGNGEYRAWSNDIPRDYRAGAIERRPTGCSRNDPADAILACAAAIENAKRS